MAEEHRDTGSPPPGAEEPSSSAPTADDVAQDIVAVEHDVDELLARLQDAEAKRDEFLDDLRRLAADFDNYRKRAVRDQQLVVARGSERVVSKLLPVLDDLERALEAAEAHDEASVLDGVRMTKDALAGVLASEGVEEIPTDGAFDPHLHEALLTQPAEGVASGVVVQVVQRGYRLGDAVIRPARVVVAE